jgi:hypothetical protein|tara:strand:+ start:364 stop:999 length:636 start_codon:yes stop_codon:yes gene_type:complete
MAGYIGGSQPVAFVTDSVDATALADDAVDSAEIADGAVDLAHMSVNSIGEHQYVDGSIATAHIADNAITSAKIGVDVIVAADLADNSITIAELSDQAVSEAKLQVSNNPTNGQFLSAQSGNTGGMTWAEVDALPSQSGHSGKFLTTDATDASWAVLNTDSNTTTKSLYEMANTISSNYTIATNYNAISAGPITVNNGISVTVPSGSTWVIA